MIVATHNHQLTGGQFCATFHRREATSLPAGTGAIASRKTSARHCEARMANTDNDPVVDHPTWFGQIRNFFTADDISHMGAKGIDLATYQGVVDNAVSIYSQTSGGFMPPDPAPKWSANRAQTFLNWVTDNFPLGTPPPPTQARIAALAAAAPAARMRKEVSTLSATEIATLKTAFAGIMARPPTQADSYFAIAGVHWYPAIDQNPQFHCLHHENRLLPWHRLHLKRFEDALRSVPGCADVTLPYWDVTTTAPAVLYGDPFAQYALQAPIGHGYDPLTTSRYAATDIASNMNSFGVPGQIATALSSRTGSNSTAHSGAPTTTVTCRAAPPWKTRTFPLRPDILVVPLQSRSNLAAMAAQHRRHDACWLQIDLSEFDRLARRASARRAAAIRRPCRRYDKLPRGGLCRTARRTSARGIRKQDRQRVGRAKLSRRQQHTTVGQGQGYQPRGNSRHLCRSPVG